MGGESARLNVRCRGRESVYRKGERVLPVNQSHGLMKDRGGKVRLRGEVYRGKGSIINQTTFEGSVVCRKRCTEYRESNRRRGGGSGGSGICEKRERVRTRCSSTKKGGGRDRIPILDTSLRSDRETVTKYRFEEGEKKDAPDGRTKKSGKKIIEDEKRQEDRKEYPSISP